MDALRCEVYATMGSLKSGQTTSETHDTVRSCKRHQFAGLNQLRDNDEAVFPKIDRRGGLLCLAVDLGNALRAAADALPSDEQCADDDLWHGHPRPWIGQGNPMMLLQPNPISFRDLP